MNELQIIDTKGYKEKINTLANINLDILDNIEKNGYADIKIGYSFENNKYIQGVLIGGNIDVHKNIKLGAFLEYTNNEIKQFNIGTDLLVQNKGHNVIFFTRYRLNYDFKTILNHNADIYLGYKFKYFNNGFGVTSKLGALFNYSSETEVDNNVILTNRYTVLFDGSIKLSYSFKIFDFNLEPKVKMRYDSDQIINSYKVEKTSIYEAGARVGIDYKINNNFTVHTSLEANTQKLLQAKIGFSYIK